MTSLNLNNDTTSTTRIIAFSDGVMAVVVTLLIFELKVPELTDLSTQGVLAALVPVAPKFIAFFISFITACIFWVNHHHFMQTFSRADRAFMWYNNHLLFWLTMMPFVTAFIGEHPGVPLVVALYGFVLMMGAVAFALMIRHVFFKARLTSVQAPEAAKRQELRRAFIAIVVYGASMPAAFINPYISLGIFALLPLYYFLPRMLGEQDQMVSENV